VTHPASWCLGNRYAFLPNQDPVSNSAVNIDAPQQGTTSRQALPEAALVRRIKSDACVPHLGGGFCELLCPG
jgi:hypothetical protein